jgi:hypothetical protein
MVGEIISEWWATSSRNGGRDHLGMAGGITPESAFLSEDIGSALKGGAKVCQRQLVSEVLGPLVTQFALNLAREDATPLQRGFHGGLLNRV